MKPNYIYIIAIAVYISIVSCTDTKGTNLEGLETEVMAIHDSVMPHMTKIYYDREKLEEWVLEDSLNQSPLELKKEVTSTIRELKTAEDAMWQWMSDFDDGREQVKSQSDSIKMEYLKENKSSIIRVRDLMLSSMSKADSLQGVIGNENN